MSKKLPREDQTPAKSLFKWWEDTHGEKKTQVALAKYMGITKETLNAKLNGAKYRPITKQDAYKIAEFFPGSRVEYIMGLDPYITEQDKIDGFFDINDKRYKMRINSLVNLARLRGFDVTLDSSGLVIGPSGGYEDIYRIERNGKKIYVPYTEMMDWIEDISDFVEIKLNRQLRQKGGSDNG